MRFRWLAFLILIGLGFSPQGFPLTGGPAPATHRVRRIVLGSRHLGAHGLGYNEQSLAALSRKLSPADIPAIVALWGDPELRVGVQFALASQCEAGLMPVRDLVANGGRMTSLDAGDTLHLIADFNGCSPATQQKALAMIPEIDIAYAHFQAEREQQIQQQKADDERIQANSLMMLDPNQKKKLTRAEREEAFQRSIKAAGMENPQTPAEKDLYQRMYRTMVLDDPPPPAPNQ